LALCWQLAVDRDREGTDVVGRARTGCGKTLAFVLPIVQSLANQASTGKLSSIVVLLQFTDEAVVCCRCQAP